MRPWLKAGLIGGGVLAILTIIQSLGNLFPSASGVISCCVCIPFLLAYPGIGVLAAYWLTPPRTAGEGAKEGALAGLIAGAIDAVVTLVMTLITGPSGLQQALQQLPPEALEGLEEMGLSGLFTTGGLAVGGCLGGLCGLLWAVAMGAAGGAILAAAKQD
ncbi:MAG: hypothetical protein RML46_11850 [Anaerolineae bacterium]|nr:hypothetical protein [Anaerolineae bacterium]MDW8069592.1 hypothetical protein [Anaerolineae bacterium]